jgi:hypothetical protein
MQQADRRGYRRLTYVVMSALVAWHTFAMIIGPAPESPVTDAARDLAQPYLTLFGLQHPWDFFAPTVATGYHFSYVIEDTAGGKAHLQARRSAEQSSADGDLDEGPLQRDHVEFEKLWRRRCSGHLPRTCVAQPGQRYLAGDPAR